MHVALNKNYHMRYKSESLCFSLSFFFSLLRFVVVSIRTATPDPIQTEYYIRLLRLTEAYGPLNTLHDCAQLHEESRIKVGEDDSTLVCDFFP